MERKFSERDPVIVESKELPYRLNIILHRHGEKASLAGDLSARGQEQIADYFREAYKGVALDLDEGTGVDIVSSPIGRTMQTGILRAAHGGTEIESFAIDPRLSEGGIAHHKEFIDAWGGSGGRWISSWMEIEKRPLPDIKTGMEVARDFAGWLLEKIEARKRQGGAQEIEAFSHYPVMMAFLVRLEEVAGLKLLPVGWEMQEDANAIINFLAHINFSIDSQEKDVLTIGVRGQKIAIALNTLKEIAQ